MSEPIKVTEEMRRAVFADMCERQGHAFTLDSLIQTTYTDGFAGNHIKAKTDGQLPHVRCSRCDKTWLVVDDPGEGYDNAVKKFRDRLKTGDPQKKS
jgi:hypothetical protein